MKEIQDKAYAILNVRDELCKSSKKKRVELQELLRDLHHVYNEYCSVQWRHLSNLQSHVNSLKTHKVDPYIAGGAAQGIAGVGAGVYSALKADDRNNHIDEWREKAASDVEETKKELNSLSKKLEALVEKVVAIIIDESVLMDIYDRSYRNVKQEQQEKKKEEKKEKNKGTIIAIVATIVMVPTVLLTDSVLLAIVLGLFTAGIASLIVDNL